MPTYEYECPACNHKWEQFQSITADPVKKCPKCGKNKARRLIGTGSSIIFKGSGFYTTDYRSDSYKKEAKAESDAASGKKPESKSGETGASKSGDAPAAKPADSDGGKSKKKKSA